MIFDLHIIKKRYIGGIEIVIRFVIKYLMLFCLVGILSLFLTISVGADCEKIEVCETQSVSDAMKEGFYGFKEVIDVSEYCILPEDLARIFSSVIKDDPYLFFVDGGMSYSYKPGGYVISLKPKYKMNGKAVFDAWDECRAFVRSVAEQAMKWDGEAERALFIHDYICEGFDYDESLESDNIYSMIKKGVGTCEAYTDLYTAILRECGIESHFVASDTIAHMWNYARIDGEWYHVDLTWDDGARGVVHRHFLLSDKVAEERGHRDWYAPIDVSCGSDKYADADFHMIFHSRYAQGDADHSGQTELIDLLLLRIGGNICEICADIDRDGTVDDEDAESMRAIILMEN